MALLLSSFFLQVDTNHSLISQEDQILTHVRWGIVGCGDVTEVKSGPALSLCNGSELVAVMRRDRGKAIDYARRHGVPRWYDRAAELIGDSDVNAVYVATPPDSHAEYTAMAARAGKPVYVEKPMARSTSECEAMISACRTAKVPLYVAYYRRSLPAFGRVKELVEEGAIGHVRVASVTTFEPPSKEEQDTTSLPWRVDPKIAGAGHFFDLGCHQLDLLDFLLGPIDSATGQAHNQGGWYAAEDVVNATFRFASGAVGHGIWCFNVSTVARTERTELIGDRGKITYSCFALDKPIRLERNRGVEEIPVDPPEHVQQPMLQAVVDALCGRGEAPSTGDTAARTSRVMDQILGRVDR